MLTFLDRVFFRQIFEGFRTQVEATQFVRRGVHHTHLSHAHCSAHNALTAYFARFHACHIHAWLKFMKKVFAHVSLISPSRLLSSHASPVLAVP